MIKMKFSNDPIPCNLNPNILRGGSGGSAGRGVNFIGFSVNEIFHLAPNEKVEYISCGQLWRRTCENCGARMYACVCKYCRTDGRR